VCQSSEFRVQSSEVCVDHARTIPSCVPWRNRVRSVTETGPTTAPRRQPRKLYNPLAKMFSSHVATMDHQDKLKRLPIPPLATSCEKFLDTIRPIFSAEVRPNVTVAAGVSIAAPQVVDEAKRLAQDFMVSGKGPELDRLLRERYVARRTAERRRVPCVWSVFGSSVFAPRLHARSRHALSDGLSRRARCGQ
jgi:hypothetical protein